MNNVIELTPKTLDFLQRRDLSDADVSEFKALLNLAHQSAENSGISSKEILQSMTPEQLDLLRKANSLADPIVVNGLSEEGATNLLRQPDHSDRVDLNNDGIVEVGIAKSMVFPPVNAPDSVKNAWEEATAGMEESDVMMLQLHMHIAVFGVQIEGVSEQRSVSPGQQWSKAGVGDLFSRLRSALEFSVELDGWTEHNKMLQGFYEQFERALVRNTHSVFPDTGKMTSESSTPNAPSSSAETDTVENAEETSDTERMFLLLQAVLDGRMGIDREKLEEIEEKIEALMNNKELDSSQKTLLIGQLEKLKEAIIEKSEQKMVDDEKRKAMQNASGELLASLMEDLLKSKADDKTVFSI